MLSIERLLYGLPLFAPEGEGGGGSGGEGGGAGAGAAAAGAEGGSAGGGSDGGQDGGAAGGGSAGDGGQDGGKPDISAVLNSTEWHKLAPAEHLKLATRYKSLADQIKGHAELEARMSKALFLPEKDAKPDEWAKVYDRLGRPKEAAGYQMPKIEGFNPDEKRVEAFRQHAHNLGLTQAQFDGLVAFEAEAHQQAIVAAQTAHTNGHKKLADGWGDEAAANYEKARRVGDVLFGAQGRKALGLGDDPKQWNPALVEALAKISPSFEEHKHYGRTERDVGKTDADLLKEADELRRSDDFMTNKDKQRRRAEIYKIVYGERPADGRAA